MFFMHNSYEYECAMVIDLKMQLNDGILKFMTGPLTLSAILKSEKIAINDGNKFHVKAEHRNYL